MNVTFYALIVLLYYEYFASPRVDLIDCLIDRLTDNWTFAVSFPRTSSGRDSEDVDRRFPFQTLRSGVTRALGAGGNSNEVRQPKTRIFLGGRGTHGARKQNAAQQNILLRKQPGYQNSRSLLQWATFHSFSKLCQTVLCARLS